MTSLPGAPTQHWHNDVPGCFKKTVAWPAMLLPPQGVVVVAPLVALDAVSGPTEFYFGTHVNVDHGMGFWSAHDESPPTQHAVLPAKRGDVVVFDMRIRHRGGANRSPRRRPIIYLGVVKDWYFDRVNFKDTQTRAWDARASLTERKLFTRIDSRLYTARLESLVRERVPGGAALVAAIRSNASYSKVGLVA